MANICCNTLTISGDEALLKTLRTQISNQDPALLKIFDYFESVGGDIYYGFEKEWVNGILDEEGPICGTFTSKWGPPTEELDQLAAAFPSLKIEVEYDESGNQVYGRLEYEEGSNTLDKPYTSKEWHESNSEEYVSFVEEIETLPYEEFLKKYVTDLESTREEDPDYETLSDLLEEHILIRTKYEDLPLMIDWSWYHSSNETEYKNRLAGGAPTLTASTEQP